MVVGVARGRGGFVRSKSASRQLPSFGHRSKHFESGHGYQAPVGRIGRFLPARYYERPK
jgi:hypothetical protein